MNRVRLSITGKNPDYFFKELIKRNINLYEVEKKYKELIVIIDYKDYEELIKMQTTYKIRVLKYFGINKYKMLLKKYKLFIVFIIISILINIFLSNLILNIEIPHPNKKLVKTVYNDLEELGIKKYHFKINYKQREEIKKKLLEKEKMNLEWVEIEEKGTTYIIKLEARKNNKKEKLCNYRHIVSKKKAIITDIKAESGEVKKKINDYVEKGDIIISGFIYNKEDIVSKRCAKGIVYGETWYKVKLYFPKEYTKKILLKNKSKGLTLKLFNIEYNFLNKFSVYEKTEYNIIDSKIIPLKISFTVFQEAKTINKKYNINNVDDDALLLADTKMKRKLNNNKLVSSKKVLKKRENNSKIEVDVFVKAKENITAYQDISNIDIEKMNIKEE